MDSLNYLWVSLELLIAQASHMQKLPTHIRSRRMILQSCVHPQLQLIVCQYDGAVKFIMEMANFNTYY